MAFWIILKRNQTQRTLDRQVRVREEVINAYRTINARQRERHLRCFHLSRYVCIPRSHTAIVPASTPFDNNQFDGRRRGEKPLRNSKKLARSPKQLTPTRTTSPVQALPGLPVAPGRPLTQTLRGSLAFASWPPGWATARATTNAPRRALTPRACGCARARR